MKRIIGFFTRLSEAWLPDAFVFSLLLTLVVFLVAWMGTPHSATQLVEFWGKDFWSLNAFAMQMIFVLISGHMLAMSPPVVSLLSFVAQRVRNEAQALVLLALISALASWINWGLGLIVSGVLALEFGRKLGKVNFGLFVATAYSGFIVWHGGLSGSIPLKMAGKDEILSLAYPGLSLPLSETVFSSWNLLLLGLLFFCMPILALWMRTDDKVTVPSAPAPAEEAEVLGNFRDKLENARALNIIFFGFFLMAAVGAARRGEALDINRVNLIFLFLALLFHGTPKRFLMALQNSFSTASGIAIQFPFYAGLMGLMQHSGLADEISYLFVSMASKETLPLWSFLSGGMVNFFVPSGGGQWVVQGPIMLKAAKELGAEPAKVSMALAWGDAWTNLIQPFWALPLLALANVKIKDIMGYCLMYLGLSGFLIASVLYWH